MLDGKKKFHTTAPDYGLSTKPILLRVSGCAVDVTRWSGHKTIKKCNYFSEPLTATVDFTAYLDCNL